MSTINSATQVSLSPLPTFTSISQISNQTEQKTNYSKSDSFSGSFVAMASSTDVPADPDAKAGLGKRMMHGLGKGFDKLADFVGLGKISQFAKQQFSLYDTDKDKKINATEFSAVSELVGKSFQEVDRNSNQEISNGEFKTIVRALVENEMATTDTNSDGFVNFNEANARGLVRSTGNLNNTFLKNDKNGDGLLSFREFADLLNDTKLNKVK